MSTRSKKSRRETFAIVAGLVIMLLSVLWVLAARSSDNSPDGSSGQPVPATTLPTVDPGPCDDSSSDEGSCPERPVEESDTLEGALERLTKGTPTDQDVKYLLIGEDDWKALFATSLGSAERVPGGELVPAKDSLLALALGSTPSRFLFQEEWRVNSGGILVEELLLLEDKAAASAVLSRIRSLSIDSGLLPLTLPAFDQEFAAELGPDAFTTSYVNKNAVGFFADRRCAVRTAVAAGPVVLIITFYEGGDCTSARAFPAGAAASALRTRVLSLLELKDF